MHKTTVVLRNEFFFTCSHPNELVLRKKIRETSVITPFYLLAQGLAFFHAGYFLTQKNFILCTTQTEQQAKWGMNSIMNTPMSSAMKHSN